MDILILLEKLLITLILLYETEAQGDADCPRGRCVDGRCRRKSYDRCPEQPCESRFFKRCDGSLACLSYSQTCPGEPCGTHEHTCADGSCAVASSLCEDGNISCSQLHKRSCQDGSCAASDEACPGEPCPADLPFKCDNSCRRASVACDGVSHCTDKEDELNCTSISNSGLSAEVTIGLFFALSVGPICIAAFVFACCRPRLTDLWSSIKKKIGGTGSNITTYRSYRFPRPSFNKRPLNRLNHFHPQRVWTTNFYQTSSDDRTFCDNHTYQPQERANSLLINNHSDKLQFHSAHAWHTKVHLSHSCDNLPADLPSETSSEMPYRPDLPSNVSSEIPSWSALPLYASLRVQPYYTESVVSTV